MPSDKEKKSRWRTMLGGNKDKDKDHDDDHSEETQPHDPVSSSALAPPNMDPNRNSDSTNHDSTYGSSSALNSSNVNSTSNTPTISSSEQSRAQNSNQATPIHTTVNGAGKAITTTTTTTTTTVTTTGGDHVQVPAGEEIKVERKVEPGLGDTSTTYLNPGSECGERRTSQQGDLNAVEIGSSGRPTTPLPPIAGSVNSNQRDGDSPPLPDRSPRRSSLPKPLQVPLSPPSAAHHNRTSSGGQQPISPVQYPVSPSSSTKQGNFSYPRPQIPQNQAHGDNMSPWNQPQQQSSYGHPSTQAYPQQPTYGPPPTQYSQPSNRGTLENLKTAAAGIHGAGETLRGTLNATIDKRLSNSATANSKNESVIAAGRSEIETGRLAHTNRQSGHAPAAGTTPATNPNPGQSNWSAPNEWTAPSTTGAPSITGTSSDYSTNPNIIHVPSTSNTTNTFVPETAGARVKKIRNVLRKKTPPPGGTED